MNRRGAYFVSNEYLPVNASLAMSYVPWQPWGDLYDERTALERGTAFPSLDMPFLARGSIR